MFEGSTLCETKRNCSAVKQFMDPFSTTVEYQKSRHTFLVTCKYTLLNAILGQMHWGLRRIMKEKKALWL